MHDKLDHGPRPATAGFVYQRFHGMSYGGSDTAAELRAEASWIREQLREGRDAYVYFNNDLGGHAIRDALELRDLLA